MAAILSGWGGGGVIYNLRAYPQLPVVVILFPNAEIPEISADAVKTGV